MFNIELGINDNKLIFEDNKSITEQNPDGTTTEIINIEEVYGGYRTVERTEITRDKNGVIIKKSHRKLGISTTKSADKAFRRAGLKPLSKDNAMAELSLMNAQDLNKLIETK